MKRIVRTGTWPIIFIIEPVVYGCFLGLRGETLWCFSHHFAMQMFFLFESDLILYSTFDMS
jgi:hypothetical protein